MRRAKRFPNLVSVASAVTAFGLAVGMATPARAESPEEKFIADLQRSNAVATTIPGTPERWVRAGYESCNRISSTIAQGLPARAAINNEVIAATTFHSIARKDAVALVTYAVLDLCPHVVPPRNTPGGGFPAG